VILRTHNCLKAIRENIAIVLKYANLTIWFTVSLFPLQYCVAEWTLLKTAVIWNGQVCQESKCVTQLIIRTTNQTFDLPHNWNELAVQEMPNWQEKIIMCWKYSLRC